VIFYHSKQKTVVNEIDIANRMCSFPVEWIDNVRWLITSVNLHEVQQNIRRIADDFY
jgi:hypothetical protein